MSLFFSITKIINQFFFVKKKSKSRRKSSCWRAPQEHFTIWRKIVRKSKAKAKKNENENWDSFNSLALHTNLVGRGVEITNGCILRGIGMARSLSPASKVQSIGRDSVHGLQSSLKKSESALTFAAFFSQPWIAPRNAVWVENKIRGATVRDVGRDCDWSLILWEELQWKNQSEKPEQSHTSWMGGGCRYTWQTQKERRN